MRAEREFTRWHELGVDVSSHSPHCAHIPLTLGWCVLAHYRSFCYDSATGAGCVHVREGVGVNGRHVHVCADLSECEGLCGL